MEINYSLVHVITQLGKIPLFVRSPLEKSNVGMEKIMFHPHCILFFNYYSFTKL